MKTWRLQLTEAARDTAQLTPANQVVLAFQFERARLAHPEGFTMNLYGECISPNKGYAVGMTPISFENVGDALDTLANIQSQWGFQNLHLGYWKDGQDGREYIDVTMVTSARKMAERLAWINEQRAIWDFGEGREIYLENPHDGREEGAA
jgi:hypothetical protein